MPKVALLNQTGKSVGDIELSDSVFNVEPNEQVLYEVVKAQRAAMRQGTHKTKGRSEVRGGGRKPWKQKGTGRARAGSTRSPIWVGGGTVFGPTPRDYSVKVNRKVRRLALKTVLTLKVRDEAFKVLDALSLESIQTKGMVEVLNNLNLSGKIMIILPEGNENVAKSARNIPGVVVTTVSHASVYEIMNYKNVLTTVDAVKLYEEVLG